MRFRLLQRRGGKVIAERIVENTITQEGAERLLEFLMFGDFSITEPIWYMGLSSSGVAVITDTAASPSFVELTSAYSNSTRIPVDRFLYGFTNSSFGTRGRSFPGDAGEEFNFTATTTIASVFLIDDSTKGGTAGALWGGGAVIPPLEVESGDDVAMDYEVVAMCDDSFGSPP